jgi:diguanylate cyclase (GGDEF)-like protein
MIDRRIAGYLLVSGIDEHDRDKFGILAQEFMLGIKRAILYQRVQEMAITDSLTGVFSRRYLMERFNEEVERSKKFNYNFSFLMVDIDHFKGYNDRYGHLVGDAILKEVARAIKENIRQIDLVGRYGGEEFSVILTETDRGGAEFAAERIRQAIEQKNIRVYDETLQATISIGIAIFPDNATDPGELIEKADQALYQAKQAGRNRVCVYTRTHGR